MADNHATELLYSPCLLGLLRFLFFCVLLQSCRGQHDLISSVQPIVARVGDDIMLPCHLEPAMDVAAKTLEWTRPDLNNVFVYVWRSGQELVKTKHPSYTGRISLFTDELKHGNMSLKLSGVKLSDKGKYKCFIPDLKAQSIVVVIVASDAAAPIVISFSGVDESTSGVVLQCESKGWYPEPEVLWLDGEENVLSAGPTETVRGPDDLYTVSSRVTVDKSNNITCRVQQNKINQTRETHIHVTDHFFKVQSRSSATTVGLAVSLVVSVMLILLLVFFLWKKKNICKRNQMDKANERKRTNLMMKDEKAEVEFLTEDQKNTKQDEITNNQLQEEKQKRERAEQEVKTLNNQLEELREKNESIDKKLTVTNEELEQTKNKLGIKTEDFNKLREKKEAVDKKLTVTTEELEQTKNQLRIKTEVFKEWEQQLQDEKESAKKIEDKLKKELEEKKKELQDEIQRGKEAEKKLNMELNNKTEQLQDEKQSGMKREDKLKKELEEKKKEWEKQLQDEKQKGKKTEETQLENKNKQLDRSQHQGKELQREKETSQSSDTEHNKAEEEQTPSVEHSDNNVPEQNKTEEASHRSETKDSTDGKKPTSSPEPLVED